MKDMKILPGNSDMKLVTMAPELKEEKDELLYRYGSMEGDDDGRASQPVLNKVERQEMVEEIKKEEMNMVQEIEGKSKNREEAMMKKEERNMVEEMEQKSKSRKETMINIIENSQSDLKMLQW